jgi:hypothetical protein
VITNRKGRESLVIAMWWKRWSWKTSVINLIEDSFWEGVDFFRFDPWLYNQEADIQKKFFDDLSEYLKTDWRIFHDSSLIENLEIYSQLLSKFTISNTAKTISKEDMIWFWLLVLWWASIFRTNLYQYYSRIYDWISFGVTALWIIILLWDKVINLRSWIKSIQVLWLKQKRRTIKEIRLEIEQALIKRTKKLVIVMDDIERLTPQQAKTIFQIVKSNANFSNTVFFLVFEKDILLKNLLPENISWEYLHKIIQVYFDIPEVSSNKVQQYLYKGLDEILNQELPISYDFDSEHWSNIYHRWVSKNFSTIRDVKRFCNSLRFNINLLVNNWVLEINPIDFIAIECLRNFHPLLFEFIKNNKALLISWSKDSFWSRTSPSEIVKNKLNDIWYQWYYELIDQLFPQISWSYDVWHWWSTWSKKQRICSYLYFDVYFSYIPGGDEWKINDYDIKAYFATLDNVLDAESYIETINKDKDVREFFQRILSYVDDGNEISDDQVVNLLLSVSNKYYIYPQWRSWMRDFGVDTDVGRLYYRWLKRFYTDKSNLLKIISKLLSESSIVYPIIHFVRIHLLDKSEEKKSRDWIDLTEKEEEDLKIAIKTRLDDYMESKKDTILKEPELLYLLLMRDRVADSWNKEKVKTYVLELVQKNLENFLIFIKLYISKSYSQTMWSYHQKEKRTVFVKWLFEQLWEDFVKSELVKLKESELYNKQKEDIDLIESWIP